MDDNPILSDEPHDKAPEKKDAPKQVDPYDIGAMEASLNEAAKRVNTIWMSFILLCVYIFIATFTVTPGMLFREAPVKMPIFNAELPLKVYFVMAPVLILALHAYLIVLIKALTEKLDDYVMSPSVKEDIDRGFPHARLDNSIILRALSSQRLNARGGVDYASIFIYLITMLILPVGLLLLTQLIFLPYQQEWMTLAHRAFIVVDLSMCLWLVSPLRRPALAERLMVTFVFFAAIIVVFFAAFPGEWFYRKLNADGPNFLTVALFEGRSDPVDYNHNGGVLLFPNRLILHDDPKLAEPADASSGDVLLLLNRLIRHDDPKLADAASASSGGVSLAVRGRNFRKAVFDRSNLARVDFSAAHLDGASLRSAILEGAKFECTKPEGWVQQDGGYYLDFSAGQDCASLNGAELRDAKLTGASFKGAQLNGADLQTATLNGAAFNLAKMRGANLQRATVESAIFSYADLLGADFSGAQGQAVNFSDAVLMAANFEYANFIASNFNGAELQGASLNRAQLIAADFNNAHMQGVDASNAFLTAAQLEGAYLQDAIFDNAIIKGTSFVSASLEGASLKCVTPFRTILISANYVLENHIRKKTPDADLSNSVLNYNSVDESKYCSGVEFTYDTVTPDYKNPIGNKYDFKDDHVPAGGTYGGFGSADLYQDGSGDQKGCDLCPNIYTRPEDLDTKNFENQLGQLLSKIPSEELKLRVRIAFERLKPGARTKEQDKSEKTFWSDLAKKAATQDSHDNALAARLEAIACVADGAPYVARGLLRTRRFDRLEENKAKSEIKQKRIFERLRKASDGGDKSCLGATGLTIADFPKLAQ